MDPLTPGSGAPRAPSGERGVTLLEALIALALLGVALLMSLGLVWQQRRILHRLQASQEVHREVEATLEALRAGALELPVGGGEDAVGPLVVTSPAAGPPPGVAAAERLSIVVRAVLVEPPPDLYRAEVEAHYRVLGEPRSLRVETLFWKPGKLKAH